MLVVFLRLLNFLDRIKVIFYSLKIFRNRYLPIFNLGLNPLRKGIYSDAILLHLLTRRSCHSRSRLFLLPYLFIHLLYIL